MYKKTICWVGLAAVTAAVLLSCSDDQWNARVFIWPPPELSTDNGMIQLYPPPKETEGVTQVVMRLWGSPQEIGYAHGFLLGPQIVTIIDYYLIGEAAVGDYDRYHDDIEVMFEWREETKAELQAMFDGIRDSGADLWLKQAGRDLDVGDLMVWNAFPDLSGYPRCEVFAVWGSESEDGTPIVARNYDAKRGTEGWMAYMWVTMVYDPPGKPFVSVAVPGYVGVVSGVNQEGVAVFANSSNGPIGAEGGRPIGVILREFLNTTGQRNADAVLTGLAGEHPHYNSWNLLAVSPQGFDPSWQRKGSGCVVECDSAPGLEVRYHADVPPYRDDIILATNTFRARGAPGADPRYVRLRDLILNKLDELWEKERRSMKEWDAEAILYEAATNYNVHSCIFFLYEGKSPIWKVAVSDGDKKAVEWGFRFYDWSDLWLQ